MSFCCNDTLTIGKHLHFMQCVSRCEKHRNRDLICTHSLECALMGFTKMPLMALYLIKTVLLTLMWASKPNQTSGMYWGSPPVEQWRFLQRETYKWAFFQRFPKYTEEMRNSRVYMSMCVYVCMYVLVVTLKAAENICSWLSQGPSEPRLSAANRPL